MAITVHRHRAVTVNGVGVTNVDEILAQGEQAMRESVMTSGATTQDPARCWLSYVGVDAPEPNLLMRCGPIFFPFRDPGAPYLSFTLGLDIERDYVVWEGRFTITGTTPQGQARVPGEVLRRPDGVEPPARVVQTLPADLVQVRAGVSGAPLHTHPVDARLVGRHYQVRIRRSALLDRYETRGTVTQAPNGRKIMIAEFSPGAPLAVTTPGSEPPPPAITYFALDVDGVRHTGVDIAQGLMTDHSSEIILAIVAVVPADAKAVRLVATEPEGEQAIDLVTGKRVAP